MSTANWLPMSLASLGPKFELFLKTAFIGCCDLTNSLGERLKSDQTMSRGYFNLSWPLNFIMNTLAIDFDLKLVKMNELRRVDRKLVTFADFSHRS